MPNSFRHLTALPVMLNAFFSYLLPLGQDTTTLHERRLQIRPPESFPNDTSRFGRVVNHAIASINTDMRASLTTAEPEENQISDPKLVASNSRTSIRLLQRRAWQQYSHRGKNCLHVPRTIEAPIARSASAVRRTDPRSCHIEKLPLQSRRAADSRTATVAHTRCTPCNEQCYNERSNTATVPRCHRQKEAAPSHREAGRGAVRFWLARRRAHRSVCSIRRSRQGSATVPAE